MVTEAPLWSVLVLPLVLAGLAVGAASFDAVLAAGAAGRRLPLVEAASPLRSAARLLFVQRRATPARDGVLWRLGGAGVVVTAVLAALVVPLGGQVVADLPAGVVWFNAMEVLVWAMLWLAGWGANSAYPLIGGYRFLAQGLSYALPLMFALITAALGAGSLRVATVVAAQQGLWFVVWMPVAFAVYLVGVLAFSFWGPLSAPVAADLAGGVAAELSGVDRLVFLAGRYLMLATGAAVGVPLFLGGGYGPVLPGWLWSLVKAGAVLAVLVWVRWRLPLVRPDRFTEIAWVVLMPLVLAQTLLVAVVVLARG
jgi:NADH-quinone oxidoreductase subunit H